MLVRQMGANVTLMLSMPLQKIVDGRAVEVYPGDFVDIQVFRKAGRFYMSGSTLREGCVRLGRFSEDLQAVDRIWTLTAAGRSPKHLLHNERDYIAMKSPFKATSLPEALEEEIAPIHVYEMDWKETEESVPCMPVADLPGPYGPYAAITLPGDLGSMIIAVAGGEQNAVEAVHLRPNNTWAKVREWSAGAKIISLDARVIDDHIGVAAIVGESKEEQAKQSLLLIRTPLAEVIPGIARSQAPSTTRIPIAILGLAIVAIAAVLLVLLRRLRRRMAKPES